MGLLPQLKAGYFQRRLFKQEYVCMFRRGHPLDKRSISLAEFSAAEHVVVISEGTGQQGRRVHDPQEGGSKSGAHRPALRRVGHILHDSDLVATVPERLAQALAEPCLSCVRHPAKLPEIAINLFWRALQQGSRRRLAAFADRRLHGERRGRLRRSGSVPGGT